MKDSLELMSGLVSNIEMLKNGVTTQNLNCRIILIEPQWGNKTYPYYFGTMKEVINSGVEVKIITDRITSVLDLKKIGLRNDDVIIFGYGWLGNELFYEIEGLQELENIKICFFHKPFNNLEEKVEFVKLSSFSLLLSSTPQTSDFQMRTDIKTVLFPYSCDNRLFGKKNRKLKKYDIGFSGALHNTQHYKDIAFSSSNLRSRAQYKISKYFSGKQFLNGSDNIRSRIRSTRSYARVLEKSKTWLSTTGPMHDMSSRYFEVAGSAAICFTNAIPEEYRHIFKCGENVIVFKEDCSDLLDVLAGALEDSKRLDEMSRHAQNEIMKNHTYVKRSEELLNFIKEMTN